MTRLPILLLAGFLTAAGGRAVMGASPQDGLARARLLYASASYEEALAVLPAVPSEAEANEVDRYKALCLLALDRSTDAEQALARIITRDPGYRLAADESPRVVELFRELRRRILPARAESLYARAKVDFADRRYAEAVEKFTEAIEIMGDPDAGAGMQELRLVAEEFRILAGERLADGRMPDEAGPARVARPEPPAGDETIYTMLSTDVTPPVEIQRLMPPWNPPADQAWRTFRGVVEVVVNRTGEVEDVQLLERMAPFYDEALTEAAWDWTFEPARLDGQPVRFRHRMQIVMRPAE